MVSPRQDMGNATNIGPGTSYVWIGKTAWATDSGANGSTVVTSAGSNPYFSANNIANILATSLASTDLLYGATLSVPLYPSVSMHADAIALAYYKSIKVVLNNNSINSTPYVITASVLGKYSTVPITLYVPAAGRGDITIPLSCNPGDSIRVSFSTLLSGGATSKFVNIIGQSREALPIFRPDGRLKPVGQNVSALAPNANATIINAPNLGTILLKSLVFSIAATGAQAVSGTVNGTTSNIVRLDQVGATYSEDWGGDGLLLDAATPLNAVVVAGSSDVTAIWDNVA